VVSIDNYAFYYCESLESISFGKNSQLTSIGNQAFAYASLTSIAIPDSVTNIGKDAFYGCHALTAIAFGENSQLMSFADFGLDNCDSLKIITIPNSVTSIVDFEFFGGTINYNGTIEQWNNIEKKPASNYGYYNIHCIDGTVKWEQNE